MRLITSALSALSSMLLVIPANAQHVCLYMLLVSTAVVARIRVRLVPAGAAADHMCAEEFSLGFARFASAALLRKTGGTRRVNHRPSSTWG